VQRSTVQSVVRSNRFRRDHVVVPYAEVDVRVTAVCFYKPVTGIVDRW
jgi:hypothetical protein